MARSIEYSHKLTHRLNLAGAEAHCQAEASGSRLASYSPSRH